MIPPIIFRLDTQLQNIFGSKWLVNHISKLGFSITANDELQFKQSANQNVDTGFEEQTRAMQDHAFAQ